MVVVGVNMMAPKVIGIKVCLLARGLFKLSKDSRPKRHPNTWRREKSKEVRDFMKVEKRGVHCKKYEGHCTK
jgi:hypothetical protein